MPSATAKKDLQLLVNVGSNEKNNIITISNDICKINVFQFHLVEVISTNEWTVRVV